MRLEEVWLRAHWTSLKVCVGKRSRERGHIGFVQREDFDSLSFPPSLFQAPAI